MIDYEILGEGVVDNMYMRSTLLTPYPGAPESTWVEISGMVIPKNILDTYQDFFLVRKGTSGKKRMTNDNEA